jgi:hypothetical protein
VIRPLQQIYEQPFDIAPYGVIVKPSHGERILKRISQGGFSPQAEYIFRKQIEEADFVIVNRIDELSPDAVDSLAGLIESQFPDRPIIRMSAKTGEGFPALLEFLDQRGDFGRRVIDVDYDVYAEGEAELGWLNSQLTIRADRPFELDGFLLRLLARLRDSFAVVSAETAHLKAIGLWEGYYAVANLVSSFTEPTISLPSSCRTTQANVIVNARVACDPERLTEMVRDAIHAEASTIDATATIDALQCFRPGRPVPTHRMLSISIGGTDGARGS